MITNILILTITAYCHCAKCCGRAGQPTASGVMPVAGRTVAASRALPFGSVMVIPGAGIRRVEDRLARRYDSRVDIFVSSHSEARRFGIRREKILVIASN